MKTEGCLVDSDNLEPSYFGVSFALFFNSKYVSYRLVGICILLLVLLFFNFDKFVFVVSLRPIQALVSWNGGFIDPY
jgi:hypothetical protein